MTNLLNLNDFQKHHHVDISPFSNDSQTKLSGVKKHTLFVVHLIYKLTFCYRDPIVTGTSILGIKFKDGVMLAGDTLGMQSQP